MKRTGILALALAMAVMVGGCFGTLARDNVLAPAMSLAWEGIAPDVSVGGIKDAFDSNEINQAQVTVLLGEMSKLSDALSNGDRNALAAANWPQLQGYALRGIARRAFLAEIGPTVAKILLQRVSSFNESYMKAISR